MQWAISNGLLHTNLAQHKVKPGQREYPLGGNAPAREKSTRKNVIACKAAQVCLKS